MEVMMADPVNSQVHLSQAVPRGSGLTWKMTGDPNNNDIHVSQNAADKNSPLNCSPACPQDSQTQPSSTQSRQSRKQNGRQTNKQNGRRQNSNNIGGRAGSRNNNSRANRPGVGSRGKKATGAKNANGCPGGTVAACRGACPSKFGPNVLAVCHTACT